jgi:threonine dehydratase
MAAAKKIAMEISRDKGMPYINGYDHPHIMAGMHVESIIYYYIIKN